MDDQDSQIKFKFRLSEMKIDHHRTPCIILGRKATEDMLMPVMIDLAELERFLNAIIHLCLPEKNLQIKPSNMERAELIVSIQDDELS